MNSLDYAVAAAQLCSEDSHQEVNKFGCLQPDRKISPLLPFLSFREYEMLERDRGKCTSQLVASLRGFVESMDKLCGMPLS